MMPAKDDIAAIEPSKRQRAEAHGAQSHARWSSGRSASHGLLTPLRTSDERSNNSRRLPK